MATNILIIFLLESSFLPFVVPFNDISMNILRHAIEVVDLVRSLRVRTTVLPDTSASIPDSCFTSLI